MFDKEYGWMEFDLFIYEFLLSLFAIGAKIGCVCERFEWYGRTNWNTVESNNFYMRRERKIYNDTIMNTL